MNREIEFRGKRKDTGEWVFGFLDHTYDDHTIHSHSEHYCYKVDPKTVGQYTGLRDMKGVKIFEGDIVSYWDEMIYECPDGDINLCGRIYKKCPRIRSVIVFSNGCFRLKDNNPLECFMYEKNAIKVIGNIHDNPELLEESK